MSKEFIRKSIEGRFLEFAGLNNSQKGFENLKDPIIPPSGFWANMRIIHVLRKTASVGSEPCTRRTGAVEITVYTRIGTGTAALNRLTDSLEDWFSFYQDGSLWLDAARTVDFDRNTTYYEHTVYVPFTYDD